jgi:hypothetical protein
MAKALFPELLTDGAGRKSAIEALLRGLPPASLPLAACCAHGGWIDGDDLAFRVQRVVEDRLGLAAELELFFSEVVGGCSCHDEPVRHPGYARLRLRIARADGALSFEPLTD